MMAIQDKQFKLELVVYFQEDEIDRKPDCVTILLGESSITGAESAVETKAITIINLRENKNLYKNKKEN